MHRRGRSLDDEQLEHGFIDEPTHRALTRFYRQAREQARHEATELAGAAAVPELLTEAARSLAMAEREAIGEIVASGVISEDAGANLLAELDSRLDELEHAAHQSEAELMTAFARLYPSPEKEP